MNDFTATILSDDGEGQVEVDLRTLDTDRLEVLRVEAGAGGDTEMVATITGILGDEDPRILGDTTRNLLHADTGEIIGEATAEQIAASDAADAQGGIILIDDDGAVDGGGGYGWYVATRVYVEGEQTA